MMKNKKGSHVGMIISFLVFVTFIAFLYSITEPATSVEQDKLDFLNYLKVELMKNFTRDLSTVLIEVNSGGSNCMIFDGDDFPGVETWNVVAQDSSENPIVSYKSGEDVEVYGNSQYVALYFSEEFENGVDGGSCSAPSYSVEFFRTEEWIFESAIGKLVDDITADYDSVKEEFSVPFDDNFAFTFKNSTEDEIYNTGERDISGNIYSEEVPIQYVDSEANIKPGFLVVRVW